MVSYLLVSRPLGGPVRVDIRAWIKRESKVGRDTGSATIGRQATAQVGTVESAHLS
jgi:hypothetical protein